MSDDERVQIARLEERHKELEKRLARLEQNTRWGVLAVLGMVVTAVMNVILKKTGG